MVTRNRSKPIRRGRPESPLGTPQPTAGPAPAPIQSGAMPGHLVFEVGWEVCQQLGGIYTVLRTKAEQMVRLLGDRYFLVGPLNQETAALELEPREPQGVAADLIRGLAEAGIPCRYGRWLVTGRPRVLLLDIKSQYGRLDEFKYLLWKDHGISTPGLDWELHPVITLGFSVAKLLEVACRVAPGRPVLAHFHEWMAGVALPRVRHMGLPVATVFTTHATLLGRYLASDKTDFYQQLPGIDADAMARQYNILSRFQIEKAAAHSATVFTTVSEVTAFEAERLLGRRPELVLPNGLNIHKFAAIHEFQNLHREFKERIQEFVMGHFFPSYDFDLDRTLFLFTSGRYEYRNKGMDVFIDAMHRLNHRLKGVPDAPTVVSFIITRSATKNINVDALQRHLMFDELRLVCRDLAQRMGQTLFMDTVRGQVPGLPDLLPEEAQVRLKRAIYSWKSPKPPTIVTHDLVDDANDVVLGHLRRHSLFNAKSDPVKVVFHPDFVSATSPLLGLDYEQFVRGCHLGIFPSYYEPWGYTPMECIAMGIPTVTSDLSGFGAYIRSQIQRPQEEGVMVLERRHRSYDESVDSLVDYLFQFALLNRRERVELRNRAERLGEEFDWSELVRHYEQAHDLALARMGMPRSGEVDLRVV